MSYSNETVHYGIPLPQQTDLVNGLDWNTSSEKVDGALYDATQIANTLKSDMEEVKEDIVDLKAEDVKIETSATELTARVSTLEQNIATDEEDIQDAFDMITDKEVTQAQSDVHVDEKEWFRYNGVLYVATKEINIGDTIVPNENCRATNIEDEMSDGGTPFDPTEINQKIKDLESESTSLDNRTTATQQMITSTEITGDTFTSDMSSNTWFRRNNDLYVTLSDVKSGESISENVNCKITTIEERDLEVADNAPKFYNNGHYSALGTFSQHDSYDYIVPSDGMYLFFMSSETAYDGSTMFIFLINGDDGGSTPIAKGVASHQYAYISVILPLKANAKVRFTGENLYSFGVGELSSI